MRRLVLGLDRVIAVLFGLILLTAGAAVTAWYSGSLRRLFPQVPKRLSIHQANDLVKTSWWPWAIGASGMLLVILGLWWLIAHLPRRRAGLLVLPGSNRAGRLRVDPTGPASTAADILADTPGVRAVHSSAHRERGQLIIEMHTTMDPRADLSEVIAATDAIATDLNAVLGRDDLQARVLLTVARRAKAQPRVH